MSKHLFTASYVKQFLTLKCLTKKTQEQSQKHFMCQCCRCSCNEFGKLRQLTCLQYVFTGKLMLQEKDVLPGSNWMRKAPDLLIVTQPPLSSCQAVHTRSPMEQGCAPTFSEHRTAGSVLSQWMGCLKIAGLWFVH